MKPDFVVIGAMKCATSTVCAYLEDHPDVFMVAGEEPNYFSHDANWARGEGWYLEKFRPASPNVLLGEGSNDYSNLARYPQSAERMAEFNPEMRIIYMVRNPLARIRSDYIQRRADSGDDIPASLDAAVRQHPEIFIDQSRYWRTLSAYRAKFPDSRIFVGFMEDMATDAPAFFRSLAGFLGIQPIAERRGHVNPSAGKSVPSRAYSALNAVPGIAGLKRLLPARLKTAVKTRLLSRPARDVDFSPELRARLVAELRPDVAQLLTFCARPGDFWGPEIAPSGPAQASCPRTDAVDDRPVLPG